MSRVFEALTGEDYSLLTSEQTTAKKRRFDPSKFEPIESKKEDFANSSEQEDDEDDTVISTAVSDERKVERDRFLIDLSKPYPKIEYTMKINGIVTFPKGNLQAVKAKAKNGKTHTIACLMTALLRGEFLAIESLIDSPKICYFATEEHISSVFNLNKKVHKLCDWDTESSHERFRVYSIREAEVEERITYIEQEIMTEEPDIVFLDGIRDLLIDFNNIRESHEVVNRLMQLSGIYNCAIVCVLHTNKGTSDFNMRGHLGTELLNKSSDVLEVGKQDDIFVVQETESRNMETGTWAFCFDEKGILKKAEIQDKKEKKAGQRIEKMEECFSKILTEDKILSYSDLRRKYMSLANVKTDAANKHIKEMTESEFLKKREDGKYELVSA